MCVLTAMKCVTLFPFFLSFLLSFFLSYCGLIISGMYGRKGLIGMVLGGYMFLCLILYRGVANICNTNNIDGGGLYVLYWWYFLARDVKGRGDF